MEKVTQAAINNQVALEINSLYKIPNRRFVSKAKQLGAKFSFGTNGRTREVIGALDFSFETARQCGLTAKDIFIPGKAKSQG